jgi:hypothetical protein
MADLKVKKSAAHLSRAWKMARAQVGMYGGGKVECFPDMLRLACQFDDTVNVLELATGEVLLSIKELDPALAAETLVCFAVHPNSNEMVTASKNGLLRHWNLAERRCVRAWKSAHSSPVLSMAYDSTGTLVATGGSDKTVQVWDVHRGFATHHFRGHAGVVHAARFHPDPRHLLLFTFSDDCTVRVWDLNKHKCAATLTEHLSPATCMVFSPDGQTFVTGGRDGVMVFVALDGFCVLKTVPVYEILEGMCALPHDAAAVLAPSPSKADGFGAPPPQRRRLAKSFCFATAGRRGVVKVWRYGLDVGAGGPAGAATGATATIGGKTKRTKSTAGDAGSSPGSPGSTGSNNNSTLVCDLLLAEAHALGDANASAVAAQPEAGSAPVSTAALMRHREQEAERVALLPAKKRGKGGKTKKRAKGSLEEAGHGSAEKAGYAGLFLVEPHTLVRGAQCW